MRDLQIVASNTCGFTDRVNELREFVGRAKPDILLLAKGICQQPEGDLKDLNARLRSLQGRQTYDDS